MVDVGRLQAGVLECLLRRAVGPLDQVGGELLELRAREREVEMLRALLLAVMNAG